MLTVSPESSTGMEAAIALTAGVGIGMLFHAPYQVFTAQVSSQLACGTSAFFLVRFTGATIGLVSTLCFWLSRPLNLIVIAVHCRSHLQLSPCPT
jgi:hypothetical protein